MNAAKKKGWDGRCDAVLPGYLLLRVDIDFGEGYGIRLGVLGGELLVERRDGFAGTAPVGIDCRGRLEDWFCGLIGKKVEMDREALTVYDDDGGGGKEGAKLCGRGNVNWRRHFGDCGETERRWGPAL